MIEVPTNELEQRVTKVKPVAYSVIETEDWRNPLIVYLAFLSTKSIILKKRTKPEKLPPEWLFSQGLQNF